MVRRAGFGDPGGIGGGQGLGAFEEGGSFGEGLAEEEELCGDEGCGREGGRWGWGDWCGGDWRGGVGYSEGEELDGVVEESVEVCERREVDGRVWRDGVCLVWMRPQTKSEGLFCFIVSILR